MFLKTTLNLPADTAIDYENINFNPTSTSTDNIDDRDLLRIFITKLYHAVTPITQSSYTFPKNTCGMLMYKDVFSQFIIPANPSSPTNSITYNFADTGSVTYDIIVPQLTGTLPNQASKSIFFPSISYNQPSGGVEHTIVDNNFVDLKLDSVGDTDIPGPLDNGLLMDGCHILAMMKLRYMLLKDIKNINQNGNSLNSLRNLPASDPDRLSDFSIVLFETLFKSHTGFGKFTNNEYNKIGPSTDPIKIAITTFLNPDLFFQYSYPPTTSNPKIKVETNYRDFGVRALWDFKNKILKKEIDLTDLKTVLDALNAKKEEAILGFAKSFYKKLGGVAEIQHLSSIIIGDGGATKGLLDDPLAGVGLFTYNLIESSLGSGSYATINDIPISDENIVPTYDNDSIIELPKFDSTKSNIKIHFDVFAIDSADSFEIAVHAFSTKKDGSEIKIRTKFWLYDVHFGISPWPSKNPGGDTWIDGTKIIGYYNRDTNDLIITNNSITKLNINYSKQLPTNGKALKKRFLMPSPEIIFTTSVFEERKSFQFSLDLDSQNLWLDDRFEILTTIKQANFWNSLDKQARFKASELIRYLKQSKDASNNITVNVNTILKGEGVGMMRIPFPYDSSKSYAIGEYILYLNKPYISLTASNTGNNPITTINTNWRLSEIQAIPYNYNAAVIPDFVISSDTIYRLKRNQTSGVINSTDWDTIASIYNRDNSYSQLQKVIFENNLYEAHETISGKAGSFNYSKWKRISRVEADPRYKPFSKRDFGIPLNPGEQKDAALISEQTSAPTNPLIINTNQKLRYSFAEFDFQENNLTITVSSFCSPLISRLDKRLLGPSLNGSGNPLTDNFDYGSNTIPNTTRKSSLDLHTLAGRNNSPLRTSFTYTSSPFSYNQVLTALRCFGILETIVCRIKSIANDTAIDSFMDNKILTHVNTKALTADLYDASGEPTGSNNYLIYSDPTGARGYVQFKWYRSLAEIATFTSC
jgi:hypothetical protein